MRAGSFFVRTWRILSILGFVGSLYSNYISFPVDVAVRFNSIGQAVQYVGRETIFYLSIGIFLLVYVLTNAVIKLFPKLPAERIPNPNPVKWEGFRQELVAVYINWFLALAAAFNTILGLGLMVLSFLNRSDRTNVGPSEYVWLLPMSTFILAAVVVSLPIRLMMKPPVEYVP